MGGPSSPDLSGDDLRGFASLLQAIGLPDLVTRSLDDYEALALRLAREPALLASLKEETRP